MPVVTTRPTPLQPAITPLRPAQDVDVPKSLFIDHAGLRLHIDWKSVGGLYEVPLEPATNGPIHDVTQFRRINVLISGTKSSPSLYLGKLAGSTLCESSPIPADGRIHSFEVTGPQMRIYFSGNPALGVEDVQLWAYLRS